MDIKIAVVLNRTGLSLRGVSLEAILFPLYAVPAQSHSEFLSFVLMIEQTTAKMDIVFGLLLGFLVMFGQPLPVPLLALYFAIAQIGLRNSARSSGPAASISREYPYLHSGRQT